MCGGGWSQRDVRCMQLGDTPGSPVSEVLLEDCPLSELNQVTQRCFC
jgi:hypothetical protein